MPVSRDRSYIAGGFLLHLDNKNVGFVRSVEGGDATSDVVLERIGADRIVKKHLAGVRYEPIEMQADLDLDQSFYEWITAGLDGSYARKSGAFTALDANLKSIGELTFMNALITEITFPAADASSKEPAFLSLKFQPEITRMSRKAGGRVVVPKVKTQKQWLPSNFRLKIDGLDEACKLVSKVEVLTIKQKFTEYSTGELRDYEILPTSIEIPNLVVSLAYSHADHFYKWHEDFVIKGNNDDQQEKNGTLEYLSPDLKQVLLTLTFKHLGIFKLTPEKVEAHREQIRRVRAEMYCEQIEVQFKT
jgi:hypothetical protein